MSSMSVPSATGSTIGVDAELVGQGPPPYSPLAREARTCASARRRSSPTRRGPDHRPRAGPGRPPSVDRQAGVDQQHQVALGHMLEGTRPASKRHDHLQLAGPGGGLGAGSLRRRPQPPPLPRWDHSASPHRVEPLGGLLGLGADPEVDFTMSVAADILEQRRPIQPIPRAPGTASSGQPSKLVSLNWRTTCRGRPSSPSTGSAPGSTSSTSSPSDDLVGGQAQIEGDDHLQLDSDRGGLGLDEHLDSPPAHRQLDRAAQPPCPRRWTAPQGSTRCAGSRRSAPGRIRSRPW